MSGAARQAKSPDEGTVQMIRFRGEIFEPLLSGALFWRAEASLLVADLHLEKMSSFARSGQLLPPYDTGMTLLRLEADLRLTKAQRIIALGDSFHRDEGVSTLLSQDRARLERLMQMAEWVWIAGNHDPEPHHLGGRCQNHLSTRGLILRHEPKAGVAGQIAGHLHPAARLAINGRSVRRPCFVHDERIMVLPAFGAATGSINILGPAFAGLLHWGALNVVMLGRDRLYPVSAKRLVGG